MAVAADHGPEQRVVGVPAAVVLHGRADAFGHGVQVADQVFDALGGQIIVALQRGVEVHHVGRVVAVVMNLHGARVDGWLQRVKSVREIRNFVGHAACPLLASAPPTIRRAEGWIQS